MQNKRFSSLSEQLKDKSEGYVCSPKEYDCFSLPRQLMEMNFRQKEFSTFDTIIFPDFLVNGSSTIDPKHIIYKRQKSDNKHGRFKPDFNVDLGNFETIDSMIKSHGLEVCVIEADVRDRDFMPYIHDMINMKFGEEFFMVPAQVALYGSKDQFLKKSYIIYHTGINTNSKDFAVFERENNDKGANCFKYFFKK